MKSRISIENRRFHKKINIRRISKPEVKSDLVRKGTKKFPLQNDEKKEDFHLISRIDLMKNVVYVETTKKKS